MGLLVRYRPLLRGSLAIAVVASLSACSIQRLAINSLSDVLASGNVAFESDDDPVLVSEALPFTLKLVETLLLQQPDDQRLLLAAASGYVFYSHAFVSTPAEQLRRDDIEAARLERARARNLFLRAHSYASRALQITYPGIEAALLDNPAEAVLGVGTSTNRDIDMLYWAAAALGLAISASRNEPALLARLPEVEALLNRALELDEAWNAGALHEFAINFASVNRADAATLEQHYERALSLSAGQRASLYVSYAETIAIPRQDRAEFIGLLDRALAINIDADPSQRLANVIAQQRASWLLSTVDELFLE